MEQIPIVCSTSWIILDEIAFNQKLTPQPGNNRANFFLKYVVENMHIKKFRILKKNSVWNDIEN